MSWAGNLVDEIKIIPAIGITAGASGTGTLNGAVLDMAGYRGVVMCALFGAITAGAVTSIKAQQDTVVGFGGAADLLGTGQTVADVDDDKLFYIDLDRPLEQFVRLVVLRATQASAVVAWYLPYRGRNKPAIQLATVIGERFISPAEGAA